MDHFHLIDAHKGRCWQPWQANQCRAIDLAALDAPAPWFFRRTERLRFLLAYGGHARMTAADKRFIRRVLVLGAPLRRLQLQRLRGIGSGRT